MAVKRQKSAQPKKLCQVCKKKPAVGRSGDCGTCLRNVYRMIESGELTRTEAEEKGLINPYQPPLKKPGRPLGNAVRRKLAKALS